MNTDIPDFDARMTLAGAILRAQTAPGAANAGGQAWPMAKGNSLPDLIEQAEALRGSDKLVGMTEEQLVVAIEDARGALVAE